MLVGLKARHEKTGDLPIFIHTVCPHSYAVCRARQFRLPLVQSGAGTLSDMAKGMYASDVIYNDMDLDQLKSIPDTAVHRNVELLLIRADEAGYVRSYNVLPTQVYSIAKHALVDAGVSNPHSVQIPLFTRASLLRGRAGMVGLGKALIPSVHIDDCELL